MVDLRVRMISYAAEDVGELGLRLDVVELARLDQRGVRRPGFGPFVMTSEERVLAIESHRGVILPVSDRK